ncbi:MAG: sigma-54 dependent transcriptional regulator [Acidiferrobacterales bacterium]|nr:sigma-54 dependent transcriptional regulator [Acidiferrobacterales bacterium]
MESVRIFLVDDDSAMRESLVHYLGKAGCLVDDFASAESALEALTERQPEVVITDVRMPGLSGIDLLKEIRHRSPSLPVSIISAHGDIPMAVEAMKLGAYNFLEKPFEPSRLLTIVKNAARSYRLMDTNQRLQARLTELSGLDRVLLGDSSSLQSLKAEILEIADTAASVLILGETGTGKEVIARALHDLSGRSGAPFVAINCAAISESLFESAMFGHQSGSFTGAEKSQLGFFRAANNGTLFLDEISSCSLEHQSKLLRAIETKEVIPVGSVQSVKVNVRIISAANEELERAVSEQRFREDLLFRLNTIELSVPPLRDRVQDIPMLYTHFLQLHAESYESEAPVLSQKDVAALAAHQWPGNVRELRHIAERHLLLSRRGRGSVQEVMKKSSDSQDAPDTLKEALNAYEKTLIENSIKANDGKMDATAEALGIGRRTLNEKLVKLGINRSSLI